MGSISDQGTKILPAVWWSQKKKKTGIIIKTALPTSKVKDNIKQYIEKGKQIWASMKIECPGWATPSSVEEKPRIVTSSVQFSHSVVSDSLQPHERQHARPPCPSPTPGVYPNPCPLSGWCHPTTSSSVIPFSSCPQSFPASGSFQMSQLFTSGGQSVGVSASTSVLPMNTQDWSPLGWTGWISLQSKGPSRVFSNTTVQKHPFFSGQLSSQSNSHIHTWSLEKPWPWLDGLLLAK